MSEVTLCTCCGAKSEGRILACPRCDNDPRVQGRYRIAAELARGDGLVSWLARREPGGALVRLDEHRWPHPGIDGFDDERLVIRESGFLRVLDHPAIPQHFGAFVWSENRAPGLFTVQAFVEGESLEVERHTRAYGSAEVLAIGAHIAETLTHMHQKSPPIVHRAIAPASIVRRVDRQLALVGFGVARMPGIASARAANERNPAYVAPEQRHGEGGPAADVYGLGVTLAVLATGGEAGGLIGPHGLEVDRIGNASQELTHLVAAMCAQDPKKRPSAAAVVRRLRPQHEAEAHAPVALVPARARYRSSLPLNAPSAPPPLPQPPPKTAAKPWRVSVVINAVVTGIAILVGAVVSAIKMGEEPPPIRSYAPVVVSSSSAGEPVDPLAPTWPRPFEPPDVVEPVLALDVLPRLETRPELRAACDRGDEAACLRYATMLLGEEGGAPDWKAALPLFERSCEQGVQAACLGAAVILHDGGHGAKVDYARALGLFENVCGQGSEGACALLDGMIESGRGIPTGKARVPALIRLCEARRWPACLKLGDSYARGQGVTKDAAGAKALYQRGCEAGHQPSCAKVGR